MASMRRRRRDRPLDRFMQGPVPVISAMQGTFQSRFMFPVCHSNATLYSLGSDVGWQPPQGEVEGDLVEKRPSPTV